MPKAATDLKRAPLNMRTTQAIRDKLEDAANKSGRSLAQEVEFIIEQHFAAAGLAEKVAALVAKALKE